MRMLSPFTRELSWPRRNAFFDDVFEDFDRLFDTFTRPETFKFHPGYELQEVNDHYIVTFDMPGVRREDVKIAVDGNQLLVTGERRTNDEEHHSYGKFERSFTLPQSVNAEKIEAYLEDGVLQLALPKAEAAKSRTIEVQAGKSGVLSKLLSTKKDETKTN